MKNVIFLPISKYILLVFLKARAKNKHYFVLLASIHDLCFDGEIRKNVKNVSKPEPCLLINSTCVVSIEPINHIWINASCNSHLIACFGATQRR